MNEGKITVKLLSNLNLIPTGHCAVPNDIAEHGWAGWLPIINLITLPQISYCIGMNFTKQEIIEFLKNKVENHWFWKFELHESDVSPTKDSQQYQIFDIRERTVKERLERNGLSYPKDLQDVINLFISLGLITEDQDENNVSCLDLLIRPFPNVSSVLKK
jgi:hypothetical protein